MLLSMSLIDRELIIDKSLTCSILRGSLRATGMKILERSLPMFFLRIFQKTFRASRLEYP